MKRLWIAAGLLVLVIGLCILTGQYRHHRMEDMLSLLEQLEHAYAAADIPQAEALAEKLAAEYETVCRIIMCYTAHSDIAESQETVMLLPRLLRQGGEEELAMEIARLREEFTYLLTIDDPLPWNIL